MGHPAQSCTQAMYSFAAHFKEKLQSQAATKPLPCPAHPHTTHYKSQQVASQHQLFSTRTRSPASQNIHKYCLTNVTLREREIRMFEWRESEHISTLFYLVSPCEVFKPNLRHTKDEKRLALLNASILWLMLYFLNGLKALQLHILLQDLMDNKASVRGRDRHCFVK